MTQDKARSLAAEIAKELFTHKAVKATSVDFYWNGQWVGMSGERAVAALIARHLTTKRKTAKKGMTK